jgi:hypothetical protein
MGERKDERFEAESEGNNHNIVGQGYSIGSGMALTRPLMGDPRDS